MLDSVSRKPLSAVDWDRGLGVKNFLVQSAGSVARSPIIPKPLRAAYALVMKSVWHTLPTPVETRIPGTGKMLVEPWDFLDSRLFFFRSWEPSVTAFVKSVVPNGAVAVDIGANIGYYALTLSHLVGDTGRVYAVEPSPDIRQRLDANIAANDMRNVTVLPFGISDKTERRAFEFSASNRGASHFGEVTDDGLELRRLADAVPSSDLNRVSFIKIDVEGMESIVLSDILANLHQLSPDIVICAELRIDENMNELLDQFRIRGFKTIEIENNYRMWRYPAAKAEPGVLVDHLEPGQRDIAIVPDSIAKRFR